MELNLLGAMRIFAATMLRTEVPLTQLHRLITENVQNNLNDNGMSLILAATTKLLFFPDKQCLEIVDPSIVVVSCIDPALRGAVPTERVLNPDTQAFTGIGVKTPCRLHLHTDSGCMDIKFAPPGQLIFALRAKQCVLEHTDTKSQTIDLADLTRTAAGGVAVIAIGW